VLHDYGKREAVADIEIPRSPAPNVVLHDYGKRSPAAVADIEIPRSPAPNVVLHDYGKRVAAVEPDQCMGCTDAAVGMYSICSWIGMLCRKSAS
jgi:hypothetical protein